MLEVEDRLVQRADRALADIKSETERPDGQDKYSRKFLHDAILSSSRQLKPSGSTKKHHCVPINGDGIRMARRMLKMPLRPSVRCKSLNVKDFGARVFGSPPFHLSPLTFQGCRGRRENKAARLFPHPASELCGRLWDVGVVGADCLPQQGEWRYLSRARLF